MAAINEWSDRVYPFQVQSRSLSKRRLMPSESLRESKSTLRKQIRPFMKVSFMLKKLHQNAQQHDGLDAFVNTNVHFIDQKMNEYWSSQRFEGFMSAKDFYVKSAEEAKNFTYYYYLGKHMSPEHIERYQRKLDLTPLYNLGQIEVTILDEAFDHFPDKVSIFEKIKNSKMTRSKLLINQSLEQIELLKPRDQESSAHNRNSSLQQSLRHLQCHNILKMNQLNSFDSTPSSRLSRSSLRGLKQKQSRSQQQTRPKAKRHNIRYLDNPFDRPNSQGKIISIQNSLEKEVSTLSGERAEKIPMFGSRESSLNPYQSAAESPPKQMVSVNLNSLPNHASAESKSETSRTLRALKYASPRIQQPRRTHDHIIKSTSQLHNDQSRRQMATTRVEDKTVQTEGLEELQSPMQTDLSAHQRTSVRSRPRLRQHSDSQDNDCQIEEEQLDVVPSLIPQQQFQNLNFYRSSWVEDEDEVRVHEENIIEDVNSSVREEIINQDMSSLPTSSIPYEQQPNHDMFPERISNEQQESQQKHVGQPVMETMLQTDEEGAVPKIVTAKRRDLILSDQLSGKMPQMQTQGQQEQSQSNKCDPTRSNQQMPSQVQSASSRYRFFTSNRHHQDDGHSSEGMAAMQMSYGNVTPKSNTQRKDGCWSPTAQGLPLTEEQANYLQFCGLQNDYICLDDDLVRQLKLELQVIQSERMTANKVQQMEDIAQSYDIPLKLVNFIYEFKLSVQQTLGKEQITSIRRAYLEHLDEEQANNRVDVVQNISQMLGIPIEYVEYEIKVFQNSKAVPIRQSQYIGSTPGDDIDLYLLNSLRVTIPYNFEQSGRAELPATNSLEESLLQQGLCYCEHKNQSWMRSENGCLNLVFMNLNKSRDRSVDEKQMFIDSYINYLLGIEFDSCFRYTLVVKQHDANYQGLLATIYHIESRWIKNMPMQAGTRPPCVNIIDVETESKRDSQSQLQSIMSRLMNQLEHIDFLFLISRDYSRLRNLAQMRWLYFCLQSRFKSNVKERVLEVSVRMPANRLDSVTDQNSSVSSLHVHYEGFQLDNRYEFDALGLFRSSFDIESFEVFDYNFQTFEALNTLIGQLGGNQAPLSLHQNEEESVVEFQIQQKMQQIMSNVKMLVVKIAQRNCLKKEFIENCKVIDSQRSFSRSEKIVSTIYQSPRDEEDTPMPQESSRFQAIQCQKCRGVSAMCGIVAKPSYEYFNELPNIKHQKFQNQSRDGQRVVTELPVIQPRNCLMNGDYCRFCNHHANDHTVFEDGSGKFEVAEGEVVVIYDTDVLRQQAETSENLQIRMNSHIWSNIQLLMCTLIDEQIECLHQLEKLITGQLRECINQLRKRRQRRMGQQVPALQLSDFLQGLLVYFQEEHVECLTPQPKVQVLRFLEQLATQFGILKQNIDSRVTRLSDSTSFFGPKAQSKPSEPTCGKMQFCSMPLTINSACSFTPSIKPMPLSRTPKSSLMMSDHFLQLKAEKMLFRQLQEKLLGELARVKAIQRQSKVQPHLAVQNIILTDQWFSHANGQGEGKIHEDTNISFLTFQNKQSTTPKSTNIWSNLTEFLNQKRDSRADEVASKHGQKSLNTQYQSTPFHSSSNKKSHSDEPFSNMLNIASFASSSVNKARNKPLENMDLERKRHSQLVLNRQLNVVSGEYLLNNKRISRNQNVRSKGSLKQSASSHALEWRKSSTGHIAVDRRLFAKRDSHKLNKSQHNYSQKSILTPSHGNFMTPVNRGSVDQANYKLFTDLVERNGGVAADATTKQNDISQVVLHPRKSLMNIQVNNSMQRLTPMTPLSPSPSYSRNYENGNQQFANQVCASYDTNFLKWNSQQVNQPVDRRMLN